MNRKNITDIIKEWLDSNNYPKNYNSMLRNRVFAQLMEMGMIRSSGRKKVPTQKGTRSGIGIEDRVNKEGERYGMLVYDEDMQKMISDMLPALKKELDYESGGEYKPKYRQPKSEDSDYVSGTFYESQIHFQRNYGPNYFSEDEINKLLNGEVIVFNAGSHRLHGRLQRCVAANGTLYFRVVGSTEPAYKPDYGPKDLDSMEYAMGLFHGKQVTFKRIVGMHRFTDAEVDALLEGKIISYTDMHWTNRGRLMNISKANGGSLCRFVRDKDKERYFREVYNGECIARKCVNSYKS